MMLYAIIYVTMLFIIVAAYEFGKIEGTRGKCERCTRNDMTNTLKMRARYSCHNAN